MHISPATKKNKPPSLTGRQARHLRGLGHHLQPIAMMGRDGITDNLLAAVDEALRAHELIKVKVQENCPLGRKEAAEELAGLAGAALAQVLGRTFLLFRASPDLPDDRRIILPPR